MSLGLAVSLVFCLRAVGLWLIALGCGAFRLWACTRFMLGL